MKFDVKESKLPGCYELLPEIRADARGTFVKTFHQPVFAKCGLVTTFTEEYYSMSGKGVLRGMHFQTPPHGHTKLVFCVSGAVIDALVDLRVGSPTYGQFELFQLNSKTANMLYIPEGIAHGFYVLSDEATMMYKVTTVYSPEHDCGILWNSMGIPWPDKQPLISTRDSTFSTLADFHSPFVFGGYNGT